MLISENNYLQHDAFLKHFGVPGMKWGVRKNKNVIKARNAMLLAKDAKRQADKKFSNLYDNAYNYSTLHLISQNFGKNKKVSNKKWADVYDSIANYRNAKKTYKDAKKAYKDAMKAAKAEYKAKYKKALSNNKNKSDKLLKAWVKDSDKYVDKRRKLKQERYYIKKVGV